MKHLQQRAQAFGFTYMPASEIVDKLKSEQIVQRVTALGPINGPLSPKQQRDADALLGLTETPKVKISQALELYLCEIALDEMRRYGFPKVLQNTCEKYYSAKVSG